MPKACHRVPMSSGTVLNVTFSPYRSDRRSRRSLRQAYFCGHSLIFLRTFPAAFIDCCISFRRNRGPRTSASRPYRQDSLPPRGTTGRGTVVYFITICAAMLRKWYPTRNRWHRASHGSPMTDEGHPCVERRTSASRPYKAGPRRGRPLDDPFSVSIRCPGAS